MKVLIAVVIVLCIPAGLVGADYFGLLGTQKQRMFDQLEVEFQALDISSRLDIRDLHITCYRKGSRNTCTEIELPDKRVTRIMLSMPRLVTRSHLFELSSEDLVDDTMTLHLVFIHPDYEQKQAHYSLADLRKMNGSRQQILLVPTKENQTHE